MIKNSKFKGCSEYWKDERKPLRICWLCGKEIYTIYNEDINYVCEDCLKPLVQLAEAGA